MVTSSRFGPNHPLWGKLLDLRRNMLSIKALLKIAHEEGYTDLTWTSINLGFQKVASGFGLPTRTALWLRRKHDRTKSLIDDLETMRFLLMEAIEEIQEVKAELASEVISPVYRGKLRDRLQSLRKEAFSYAERARAAKTELERVQSEGEWGKGGGGTLMVMDAATMKEVVAAALTKFDQSMTTFIGTGSLEEAAVDLFGNSNVRPDRELPEDESDKDAEEGVFVDDEESS